jgi:hypothetical protein
MDGTRPNLDREAKFSDCAREQYGGADLALVRAPEQPLVRGQNRSQPEAEGAGAPEIEDQHPGGGEAEAAGEVPASVL